MSLVKEEIIKGCISAVFTIGIAIAGFWLSNSIQSKGEYRNIVNAVKVEAQINEQILENSFTNLNMRRKTIIRDFSLNTVQYALADKNFIEHCDTSAIRLYFNYYLNLQRMSGFKRFAEQSLIYPAMDSLFTWDQFTAWESSRNVSAKSIKLILELE